MPSYSIVIVEDDVLVGGHLCMSLEALGCRVRCVTGNYAEALEEAASSSPDLALIDINIGGIGAGIETAGRLRREFGTGLVLLLSQVDDELIRQVAALEPLGLLMKPFQHDEMRATVRAALAKAAAESKAADNERRQATVLDAISDGYWDYDIAANNFVFSPKWIARTGYGPERFRCANNGFSTMVHPEDLGVLISIRDKLNNRCIEVDAPVRFKHADGSWHWYHGRGRAVEFDRDGVATRVVGVVQDITENIKNQEKAERISAQQALMASENKYKELINSVQEGILIIQDDKICFCNDVAAELTGNPVESLVGKSFYDFVLPQDRQLTTDCQTSAVSAEGKGLPRKFRLTGRYKHGLWVQCQMAATNWNGKPAILACLTNINDSVQVRASLERYAETLQALIDASPLAIVVVGRQGRVVHWGGAAEAMFGWPEREVLGCPNPLAGDYQSPDTNGYTKLINEVWYGETKLQLETVLRRKDGTDIYVSAHKVPITTRDGDLQGMLCMYEDVTQRKKEQKSTSLMQARLAKMQRLEAISTLAGGIAHEFNNVLAAITGYNELALEDMEEGQEMSARKHLQSAADAATRGRDLVKRLVPFTRHVKVERTPVDMAVLLPELLKLIRSVLPSWIKLKSDISQAEAVVSADTAQVQQVLINLCNNTKEALDGKPGRITVSTSLIDLDEDELVELPGLGAGRHLRLLFSDNGPGMDQETAERAFDPFFSAKKNFSKSGLGLTEVHGIITGHQGWVEINSDERTGTEVVILLPLSDEEPEALPSVKEKAAADVARILFVDDETTLVEVFTRTLSRMGHIVSAFSDSRLAVEAFKSEPESFDLIITDQSMPHISGLELARVVRETRQDLPVIICTGYSEQLTPENKFRVGVEQVLMKPVDRQTIAQAIDLALLHHHN